MECSRIKAMRQYISNNPPTTKICPVCKKEFSSGVGQERTLKARCCSDACNAYYQNHRPGAQEKRNIHRAKDRVINLPRERAYQSRKYRQDPQFAITRNLRSRVNELLRYAKAPKLERTSGLIGCSGVSLMKHLEAKFQPGMSWENYGQWHIDHIRPCASFDLTDPEQQKQCFHYTNLQPLWGAENISKGAKWDDT